ncbi:CSN12-like protein [Aphelenchoides besseyi]|nr:CSN12-like protein [Aphelenchoides besseyi]KAI6232254.1 CSN12-like protein [Aphelenchoides besseyi]
MSSPSTVSGDNFYGYYNRFNDLIREQSWVAGEFLSELFSCQDSHAQSPNFQIADIEDDYHDRNVTSNVFDDMVAIHCRVLYFLSKNEPIEAYAAQTALVQYYNKEILVKEKDANWFIPILTTICRDLRIIASMADKDREIIDEEEKSFYEEAAEPIMESFRTCVTEGRNAIEVTKKIAIMSLANQLFRIYLRINRPHLFKPLIRAIDQAENLNSHFEMADKVTYKYFVGRKAIFDNDLKLANEALSFAFTNCPSKFAKNKRLTLIYLVPVKMFFGFMPNQKLLEEYDLSCFQELVLAVREGNVGRLIQALQAQETLFIDYGIFLLVEKLKLTTFLNLIKIAHKILKSPQIKLDSVVTILKNTNVVMDTDEVGCHLANLISQKKMKGYISYNHQTLVLSKADPFPTPI